MRAVRRDVAATAAAGFDGIIGNPPWEGFKPIRKEFAANFYRGKPQFSKMGMDGPTFEKWFAEELKANTEFAARWREHEEYYERHKEFFGRTFQKQGTGDWNLFKLFIERDLSLVRQGGQFSLLVPSGIQTDEGCADLRRWFITEHRLDELTSFENRGYTEIENGKEQTEANFPGRGQPHSNLASSKSSKARPRPKTTPSTRDFISTTRKMLLLRRFVTASRCCGASRHRMFSVMEFRSPEDYARRRQNSW